MLAKFWAHASCRNFSKSFVWKNLQKKTPDPPSTTSSTGSSSQAFQLARMPTEFEKKILIYSGRFKTRDEIPKLVTSEMLDKAKTKIRIKIANLMILCTAIACGAVIYEGKSRRKDNIKKWEEKQAALKQEKEQTSTGQAS